ncbi:MAG: amino acid transporter [Leptolyngbya sp.]|nr:amino acid transporter [Candidatus Melainabacteria bacterium]
MEGAKANTAQPVHQDSWWKVMCLTGVDYFSTLGYQPGIAFLAAGLLSPVATLVLVLMTLFAALPTYFVVAQNSPNGQGSVSMLERLLPGWKGKTAVLILLGFAATAFIITITLSAADATAHIIESPVIPDWVHGRNRVMVTLLLLSLLSGVFLKGFREAIGVAAVIVAIYLCMNAVVLFVACQHLMDNPDTFRNAWAALSQRYSSPWEMVAVSCLLFPKLALGLSGFETGVAVMPLVKGDPDDDAKFPAGRIRNSKKLLAAAAIIMCFYLVFSSITTSLLIKPELFTEGGEANGRALSYLCHNYLGHVVGSFYDLSTISILWFAGASAIAGLLTLVPKYLPRYGMAPDWALATRPLIIFFFIVEAVVTIWFKANVDAQAGAYATGVLVLMTSAAVAATLAMWKKSIGIRISFVLITGVFIYTLTANTLQNTEGLQIASFFILAILVSSLISRAIRSTELRIQSVLLDETAEGFITQSTKRHWGEVRILAHRPDDINYGVKEEWARHVHSIQHPEGDFIFFEVTTDDTSEFIDDCLEVRGQIINGYQVLKCTSSAVPNALAALLLYIRDKTHKAPHCYLGWTEGHPFTYIVKYIFLGEGETAPLTREILRSAEPNSKRRPIIHVG